MRRFITLWLLMCSFLWGQQWELLPALPIPVAGAEAVATDTSIFLMGGTATPVGIEVSIPLIQEYSIRDGFWKCPDTLQLNCGLMQTGRKNFIAGFFDDKIYFAGGTADFPALFTMESWAFDGLSTNHNVNPEFNRTNAAGLIDNGKFYLVGGFPASTDSLPLSYIVEYDIASGTITWQEDSIYGGHNLPYDQMVSRVGNELYIFGGTRFGVVDDVLRLNLSTRQISNATPINGVRAGGKSVATDSGEVYILGGYNESQSALQTVELYDVTDVGGVVTPGLSLTQPRHNFAAVYSRGAVYVLGGFDAAGNPLELFERLEVVTPIADLPPTIENFRLRQNYPNPFNPQTTIEFDLPVASAVTLDIYDILGRHVVGSRRAVTQPGTHKFVWDATDANGQPVTSGVYFYRLTVDKRGFQTRKMVLDR